jgi:hypothetical protein
MRKLSKFPALLLLLFIAYQPAFAQTTIDFAGQTWIVRTGGGGPGPNHWSDSPESVWVDNSGQLHLKIRKQNDIWYCSEVYAPQSVGHGEYILYLATDVEVLDPNVVTGFFTYETDTREIDIEFSRWGDTAQVDGWYTVQPVISGNQSSFSLHLNGRHSTHKFNWQADSIHFESYYGYSPTLPSNDSLIKSWTYTGHSIPPAGNELFHINFWLMGGKAPTDGRESELIIHAVSSPQPENVIVKDADLVVISPNPVTDYLSISLPAGNSIADVTISTSAGKEFLKNKIVNNRFAADISSYPSGIYIVAIRTSKQTIFKKIIKL